MKRLTTPWTTALATAALLALPAAGSAQTPQTPPEPQPEQSTTLSTPATQNESPAEHLRQAKDALANIDANNVPARAKSQIATLRRHINSLERSVAASDSATGTAQRSSKATGDARGKANWANDVAAIDRIITQLAGSGTAPSTGSGDPATAGTTGSEPRTTTKSKSDTAVTLDEPTKNKLMEVRTHITAFAAAMSGTSSSSPSSSPAAASQQPPASSTGAATRPQPTATEPPAATPAEPPATTPAEQPATTPGAAGQTGTPQTDPTMTDQPDPTAAAQPKVDAEAAKQHLTAARETLTQLTQLPAAAQLQGDARTQVSQLIQNFNELITTQANWRETYAKLEGNLNALIGPAEPQASGAAATAPPTATAAPTPEPAPTDPPATQPANPPAGTQSGTPGAVGTSGTTAAPTLDPAVRQKLTEFRTHLLAFHTAAGGDESKDESK